MLPRLRIHRSWSFWGVWYRLVDAIGIVLGLVLCVPHNLIATDHYVLIAAGAIIIYNLLAEVGDMYRNWRGVSRHREAISTILCWSITWLLLLVVGFATKHTAVFSRVALTSWFIVTPALIIGGRIATRWGQRLRQSLGYDTKAFAIVGVNELAFQLAKNIEASPELGLTPVGFFDDRPEDRNPEIPEGIGRQVGTVHDLVAKAKSGEIDRIYITFPMRAEDRIRSILHELADTTASVYIVPDFFVFQLLHSRWTDILGLPAVSVFENPLYGIDGVLKRIFDLVLGSALLIILAVPIVVIAIAIKLTSAGPVFFRQTRYGLDGDEIIVWKFRTMTVCEQGENAVQAKRGDPRVTPLGALLRRFSIDELPQLLNVLAGNMSLVGPRPHANAQNEEFRTQIQGYMLRHKVKPGITGLAQVNGWRGETDVPEKMQKRIEFDHRYIREWSLWLDIKILFKTIFVVISGKNAY
jgi:putative colanic acid biosysnthesis UDP-glucose lipid carrier transferase